MSQTWSNVLDFIKINFGLINKLEISDDDLVKYLKSQVLPFFSQYDGRKKFKDISDADLITSLSGQPMFQYKIPLDPEEYIIRVLNFYPSRSTSLLDVSAPFLNSPESAMDLVISNSYRDIIKSMQAQNTWEFRAPATIIFDFAIGFGIIEYMTVHTELNTISPDTYQLMFKKLCLANVKIWIAASRSKFENLTTPFGTLALNWEALKTEGVQEREDVVVALSTVPPDWLLHIDV